MEKVFLNVSVAMLPELAKEILSFDKELNIFKFEGNLGAGKTTLIKYICKELGITQPVQSPTFSIVNVYEAESGEEIYHFDCYRLKKQEEAFDFGMEEYLDSGSICLIEWPQIIDDILPIPHLLIRIEGMDDRTIILKTIH
jgi:tRNA threonylcarbamoyladenosine biosynthesis protein TsaE